MNKTTQEKGLFLQEFYGVKDIPELVDSEGNPTKFAEAAKYWGENIPSTESEVKELVAKGKALVATENLSISQKFSQNSIYGGREDLSLLRHNKVKVPFVKKGAWKHNVYGEVVFEDEDLNQLIKNFNNNVTGFTPYLTLGHLDEEPDSTDSHRKRGDLENIIIEEDTAFGIFNVPDNIYEAVQNGEYEYSSGEFHRGFTDKNSGDNVGTTVIRVALTNSPFLPFGDKKVQALSEDAESCPETKENYVFLLSLDTTNSSEVSDEEVESAEEPKEDVKSEVESKEELKEEPPVEETKEQSTDIENTTLTNNESIMSKENTQTVETQATTQEVKPEVETKEATLTKPETAEVKEVEVKEEPVKAEKANQGDAVLANLTSQLQKVQELYQTQLEAANKTIGALTDKVDALTDKLAGQEKVTQAFSSSMSQAQEHAMIQSLQANGVLPSNIQKFLSFKNAFETADNKNIVKFSVGVGEDVKIEEKNVIDSVAELLISASNQAPLVEQQLGISAGRKTGAFDFSNIIEKNNEAAKKFQA